MRTTDNWLHTPGNIDVHNLAPGFGVEFANGWPVVQPFSRYGLALRPIAESLTRFSKKVDASSDFGQWAHFFMDDYRFEKLWNRPASYIYFLNQYNGVLGPDFSCYVGWPDAVNMYNVYRNRWLTSYWQAHGIKVLPTVTWSDDRSYDFAFLGLPRNDVYAIGGCAKRADSVAQDWYERGIRETLVRLRPIALLVYGALTPTSHELLYRYNVHLTFADPTRVRNR